MHLSPLFLAGPAGRRADRPLPPSGSRGPALLCDRDGTVIENRDDYVRHPSHIAVLPGAIEALRRAADRGITIVLISNQSSIGRGLLKEEQVLELHRCVLSELSAGGVPVTGTYLCPHAPEQRCGCRKPQAGMIRNALADLRLDAARTVMVGDAVEDMRAARSGGVDGILVHTGRGRRHAAHLARWPELKGTPVVADLSAAVDLICDPLGREATCAE